MSPTDFVFLWIQKTFFAVLKLDPGTVKPNDLPPVTGVMEVARSGPALTQMWDADRAKAKKAGHKPSLVWTIFRFARTELIKTIMLTWVGIFLNVAVAALTDGVVKVVAGEYRVETGYILAVTIGLCICFGNIFLQQGTYNQTKITMVVYGALQAMIFRKPGQVTSAELSQFTEGNLINLLAQDCQAVLEVGSFMGFFAMAPFQLVLCTVLLYTALGPASLLGLGILALNVVLIEHEGNLVKMGQLKRNMLADSRVKLLNEALQGMRTVKLLAWEAFIERRILAERANEVSTLRTMAYHRAKQAFLSFGLPTVATTATFVLYQALGNELDAATVFTGVGLFEFLAMSLVILPNLINEVKRVIISIKRIEKLLIQEDTFNPNKSGDDKGRVVIKNGNFYWGVDEVGDTAKDAAGTKSNAKSGKKAEGSESTESKVGTKQTSPAISPKDVELTQVGAGSKPPLTPFSPKDAELKATSADAGPEENQGEVAGESEKAGLVAGEACVQANENESAMTLKDINLDVSKGQLVAVVGSVASGKTSLANAILQLMSSTKGSEVSVGGNTAFVAQTAFCMNDTVKENIIFGGEMDEAWYNKCVKACALQQDFEAFLAGDMTQVGERGITISGGQKQRLAIARAAYSRPDVVVLDDPLSAMDAHVGKTVFEECILNLWRKSGVTVILVTNQLWVCDQCDAVVLLEEGRISETGSFSELMELNGHFHELMSNVTGQDTAAGAAAVATTAQEKLRVNETEGEGGGDGEQGSESEGTVSVGAKEETKEEGEAAEADAAGEATNTDKAGEEASDKKEEDDDESAKAAEAKKESGKIMTKESRSAGRVGLKTARDAAASADSKALGYGVAALAIVTPVVHWFVSFGLSRWTADTSDTNLYIYLSLGVVFAICAFLKAWVFNEFFVRSSVTLHNRMLNRVLASPMSLFDTTPVGRMLLRFNQDLMIMDILLPRIFEFWTFLNGMVMTAIIMSSFLIPPMLVLSIVLLYMGALIFKYVGAVILDLRKLGMVCASFPVAKYQSFIVGLDSVRAFGRVHIFAKDFDNKVQDFITAFFTMGTVERWVNAAIIAPLTGVFMALMVVVLVAMRELDFVTPESAGLAVSYLSVLGVRVPAAIFLSTTFEQLLYSVERVVEYASLTPEPDVEPLALEGAAEPDPAAKEGEWPGSGAITAKNVKLKYRDGLPLVLKGASFSIASGERVGIVGRTGAGKSTLALAAFRMARMLPRGDEEQDDPESGFEVDGVDVRRVPLKTLRSGMGMIPQDPWLFSGTLRENIDPFGEYTDAQIYEVLDLVKIGNYVRSLGHGEDEAEEGKQDEGEEAKEEGGEAGPEDVGKRGGYAPAPTADMETDLEGGSAATATGTPPSMSELEKAGLAAKVLEKGENYSTGTIQLFCLARVLLRRPRVCFMDEATASVDLATDTAVQEAIRAADGGLAASTLITVAHRLQTIIDFDKIIVMADGAVKELGHPHDLLQDPGGVFTSLVEDTGPASAAELRVRAKAAREEKEGEQ